MELSEVAGRKVQPLEIHMDVMTSIGELLCLKNGGRLPRGGVSVGKYNRSESNSLHRQRNASPPSQKYFSSHCHFCQFSRTGHYD
jgi:hypothetical protein